MISAEMMHDSVGSTDGYRVCPGSVENPGPDPSARRAGTIIKTRTSQMAAHDPIHDAVGGPGDLSAGAPGCELLSISAVDLRVDVLGPTTPRPRLAVTLPVELLNRSKWTHDRTT